VSLGAPRPHQRETRRRDNRNMLLRSAVGGFRIGAQRRFPNCLAGAILYLNIEMLAGIRRRFEPA